MGPVSTKAWDRGTGPSVFRGVFRRPADDFLHGATRPGRSGPPPAALLWDMDGLLVDSEPVWTLAEQELFARWGVPFTPAMKADLVGGRLDASVPKLIAHGGPAAAGSEVAEIQTWLLSRMAELFAESVPLMTGARTLFEGAAARGVPQALVSSSYRVLVDAVLEGISGHPFAVSVAGDEVVRAKPDPEPYLDAAAKLAVAPTACLVLEDTPTGARAGTAAGASVLYCPSVSGAGAPESGWWAVRSLRDVTLEDALGAACA